MEDTTKEYLIPFKTYAAATCGLTPIWVFFTNIFNSSSFKGIMKSFGK